MPITQLPLGVTARISPVWPAVERDVQRFVQPRLDLPLPPVGWGDLLQACRHRPFRSTLYARLRASGFVGKATQRLLRVVYRGEVALEIHCDDIGPGFLMMHGFATIVLAERIGQDCQVGQQVTVGYSDKGGPPILGDRVRIGVGAIVIGPVTLGDDSVVGANAVVVNDVPPATVVGGIPAQPLRGADDAFSAAKAR